MQTRAPIPLLENTSLAAALNNNEMANNPVKERPKAVTMLLLRVKNMPLAHKTNKLSNHNNTNVNNHSNNAAEDHATVNIINNSSHNKPTVLLLLLQLLPTELSHGLTRSRVNPSLNLLNNNPNKLKKSPLTNRRRLHNTPLTATLPLTLPNNTVLHLL